MITILVESHPVGVCVDRENIVMITILVTQHCDDHNSGDTTL
jgi:hypothetical protein